MNLKVFKILVVGFGNIGFRHFEGLLKTNLPLNIYIVDPDDKAFNRVNQSYKDGHYDNIKCFMFKTLTNIPSEIDLCIISTSSKIRLSVAVDILTKIKVKYLILEKVLFQKESDYDVMSKLIKKYNINGCWVNCPLRTFEIYKELKEKINNNLLDFYVEYDKFGICCNSIHQLDLFSYLTDCYDLKIETSQLERVIESKRKGYLEILGILKAYTSKGDQLTIHSNLQSGPNYVMRFKFKEEIWTIYPFKEKVTIEKFLKNEVIEKVISYPKQSFITNELVSDILLNGKCNLAEYDTSKNLHLILIKNLNVFFSKVLDYEVVECPIT
jgi:hypothetical protein